MEKWSHPFTKGSWKRKKQLLKRLKELHSFLAFLVLRNQGVYIYTFDNARIKKITTSPYNYRTLAIRKSIYRIFTSMRNLVAFNPIPLFWDKIHSPKMANVINQRHTGSRLQSQDQEALSVAQATHKEMEILAYLHP